MCLYVFLYMLYERTCIESMYTLHGTAATLILNLKSMNELSHWCVCLPVRACEEVQTHFSSITL